MLRSGYEFLSFLGHYDVFDTTETSVYLSLALDSIYNLGAASVITLVIHLQYDASGQIVIMQFHVILTQMKYNSETANGRVLAVEIYTCASNTLRVSCARLLIRYSCRDPITTGIKFRKREAVLFITLLKVCTDAHCMFLLYIRKWNYHIKTNTSQITILGLHFSILRSALLKKIKINTLSISHRRQKLTRLHLFTDLVRKEIFPYSSEYLQG